MATERERLETAERQHAVLSTRLAELEKRQGLRVVLGRTAAAHKSRSAA